MAYIYGWHMTFVVFGMLYFIGALAVVLAVPDDRNDMRMEADIRLTSPRLVPRPDLTDMGKLRYFVAWFSCPAPLQAVHGRILPNQFFTGLLPETCG